LRTNKRSIWIFRDNIPTPDLPGATRQYDFAKELERKGYQVTIFTASFSYMEHRDTKLFDDKSWKIENIDGVKFVWFKSFPFQKNDWRRVINIIDISMRSFWLGLRICRLNNEITPPDVVIGFSVPLIQPLAAYYVARSFKSKYIIEVGDLWPQTIVDMGVISKNNPIVKLLYAIEKFLYLRADKIITALPFAEEYIGSLSIDIVKKEKIVWIPSGIDIRKYQNIKGKTSTDQFKVIYLGAHGPSNALDILLDAAKIVYEEGYQNIYFVLIGDGSEKKELILYRNKLGLSNVEFQDPVPKSQVTQVLADADACVYTYRNLGLLKYGINPNKLFEYAAASKPIIFVSNAPNNIVKEAQCGISIDPGDPKKLAEAVIYLYKMPTEERLAMGRRGFQYIRKHYDLQVLGNKFEKVIVEVIRKG